MVIVLALLSMCLSMYVCMCMCMYVYTCTVDIQLEDVAKILQHARKISDVGAAAIKFIDRR